MRILWLVWAVILLSCANTTSTRIVPANVAERISFRDNTFDVYQVRDHRQIRLFWKNKNGQRYANFTNLNTELRTLGDSLLFAMNGGMYMPDHRPQGLYIESGKTLQVIDKGKGRGNFYMKPNGIFVIDNEGVRISETTKFDQDAPTLFATQSGPMLLIDGAIHPAFNEGSKNLHIRNGVGVADDGSVVFAISNKPVNFYDFASLFKEKYDCQNALYLDGFVSKCYLPELGRSDDGGNFGVIIGVVVE